MEKQLIENLKEAINSAGSKNLFVGYICAIGFKKVLPQASQEAKDMEDVGKLIIAKIKEEKKYFLDCDTRNVYSVPKNHWRYLDIINDEHKEYNDFEVTEAKYFITKNCEVVYQIDAMTQTL